MTDRDFLRMILENPTDCAPRKVYADWLEERGECDRAEFIRVQCELTTVEPPWMPTEDEILSFGIDTSSRLFELNNHNRKEKIASRRRSEAELLAATTPEPCPRCEAAGMHWLDIACRCNGKPIQVHNAVRWAGKLGGLDPFLWVDQNNALGWHVGWNWAGGENGPRVDARFINGFIGCVSLSCQALMGERCPHETILLADHHFCLLCHGSGYVGGCAADLARFPLTSVELSDKRPTTGLAAEIWFEEVGYVPEDVSYSLPTPLFEALDGFTFEAIRTTNSPSRQKFYASAASAQAALSRAACQHVRSLRKELVTA